MEDAFGLILTMNPSPPNAEIYIDCHTHFLPPKRSQKLIKWARTFMPDHPVSPDVTIENLIQDLFNAGARRWVNLLYPIWRDESRELNRFGAELSKKFPQITTFGGVSITDADPLGVVREAIEESGLSGIKFHPMVQRFSPAEESLKPIYPYLEKGGRAVYLHTGYDEWYNWTLPPHDVEWIIENHPGMGVVLSHIAFPRVDWAFDLAVRHQNVWLDTTNVFGGMAMIDKWSGSGVAFSDVGKIRDRLAKRIPELSHRIMFGTDHPAGIGDIPKILADLRAFNLDKTTMKRIMIDTPELFLESYGLK